MRSNFPEIIPYEQRLDQNARWALSEGSRFFEEKSAVQEALRKITSRLNELGIPYSVVGGMALFHYGYRRFTEDVDLLVSRDGLRQIHEKLDGLGYVPPFIRSKNLRDAELGVKIEFLIAGDFPGDGKPKPVAFPDPAQNVVEADGVRYLNLNSLLELKLASGMSAASRMKDLSDVIELIRILGLPTKHADLLHPYVQEKFKELWQSARRRFVRRWRRSAESGIELDAMQKAGVVIEASDDPAGDWVLLSTTDPEIAKKFGLEDESELWNDSGDDLVR